MHVSWNWDALRMKVICYATCSHWDRWSLETSHWLKFSSIPGAGQAENMHSISVCSQQKSLGDVWRLRNSQSTLLSHTTTQNDCVFKILSLFHKRHLDSQTLTPPSQHERAVCFQMTKTFSQCSIPRAGQAENGDSVSRCSQQNRLATSRKLRNPQSTSLSHTLTQNNCAFSIDLFSIGDTSITKRSLFFSDMNVLQSGKTVTANHNAAWSTSLTADEKGANATYSFTGTVAAYTAESVERYSITGTSVAENTAVVSMRSTSVLENLLYVRFLAHTRTSRLKAQQRQRNQGRSVGMSVARFSLAYFPFVRRKSTGTSVSTFGFFLEPDSVQFESHGSRDAVLQGRLRLHTGCVSSSDSRSNCVAGSAPHWAKSQWLIPFTLLKLERKCWSESK